MTNIFKILNAKLKSGNNKAIGKVRDRLEHARANAVKDRVVAKSGLFDLSVNTSCDENDDLAEGETWEEYHNRMRPSPRWYKPTSPASINGVSPESPKYTCTEDLEDTPFKSMNHRGETKALFEERIAADAALAKNPIFSVPTLAAALVIQRAYRAKASIGIANDPRYAASFLARNPLIRIAAVSIQSTWRGRVVAKNIAAVAAAAPEDRRAAASASLNIQRHWRGRVAKNTAAMLIKEQKKSTAQLAIKGRESRKRKLAASSFKDCRKRVRNNALARDRHAKRKRTQVQNARAAKRFRDFIEYVRFSTSDTVIEDFESEVLNGGVIDDVRMDHADTYESDSE